MTAPLREVQEMHDTMLATFLSRVRATPDRRLFGLAGAQMGTLPPPEVDDRLGVVPQRRPL